MSSSFHSALTGLPPAQLPPPGRPVSCPPFLAMGTLDLECHSLTPSAHTPPSRPTYRREDVRLVLSEGSSDSFLFWHPVPFYARMNTFPSPCVFCYAAPSLRPFFPYFSAFKHIVSTRKLGLSSLYTSCPELGRASCHD